MRSHRSSLTFVDVISTVHTLPRVIFQFILSGILLLILTGHAVAADGVRLSLNEGDGEIAIDINGTPTNGVLSGYPNYDGDTADGSAFSLRLDGIDDFIDLGTVDIVGSELTLAAWFNIDQFTNSIRDSRIVTKADSISANNHYFMLGTIKSGNSTRLRARVRIEGSTKTITDNSNDLVLDTWYHGAVTYDGSNLRLFINGVEVANNPVSGTINSGAGVPVAVGALPGGGRLLRGRVDDVSMLPFALNAEQILELVTGQPQLVANDDNYVVPLDGLLIVDVTSGILSNDSVLPDTIVEIVEEPGHGAVILELDNSFTYIPSAGYSGNDSFSYRLKNGTDISNTAMVNISVVAPTGDLRYYISSSSNGSLPDNGQGGSLSFRDEDILVYDTAIRGWSMFFDGSDVGLSGDIDAFAILEDGSALISLTAAAGIPGVGNIDDSDIVRFVPLTTGDTTSGTFEIFFDGSDVGLTSGGEDISALTLMDNGDLLISTTGNFVVSGLSAADEDLLLFSPTQLGGDTAGTWSLFFDGSDFGLLAGSEDVRASSIVNDQLYLATAGAFSVDEATGNHDDILQCLAVNSSGTTNCEFSVPWRGNEFSFGDQAIDALAVVSISETIDSTAPVASPMFSPEPSLFDWYNTDVAIDFNWSDNVRGSGLDTNNCESGMLVTGEGAAQLYNATCSDLASNIGIESGTLSIDKLAPVTALTNTPPSENAPASATFEFQGIDDLSGVSVYECQLDNGNYSSCVSPLVFTGLSSGTHTLKVRAIDLADNREESPASYTWSVSSNAGVDDSPPLAAPVFIPGANAFDWHNSDVTITFNWIDPSVGLGIDPSRCTELLLFNLEGENLGFSGSCTDLASNTGEVEGTLSIDKTEPETVFTSPPATGVGNSASFEFTGTDALSGINRFECKLNNTDFSTCTNPHTYTNLSSGEHTFAVRAIDRAGNIDSTPVTYTWNVDTQAAADASRFLQMAALGATDTDINAILSIGSESWLDAQLDMIESGSRFDWMVENGFANSSYRKTNKGFDNAVWNRIFTAENTVVQRWVLVLSELFVINPFFIANSGTWEAFAGAAYLDLLETHGLGNYRELLEEVTLSHQMGAYLSMRGSKKTDETGRAPDENYAREILQLFSIGLYELNNDGSTKTDGNGNPVETYTNEDIEGLAAAFTGWQNDFTTQQILVSPEHHRRRLVMQSEFHENGEISFLGTDIPANTSGEQAMEIALDTIASHPNVAPFLAKQFIQRLVTSNPTAAYVNRVASVFNQNENGERGNLRSVLRAILLDPEANGVSPINEDLRGKLREPMLRFIQWGRTFNLNSPTGVWYVPSLSKPSSQLGQSPLRSPSVFNFFRPGYVPPNTELGDLGLRAPELQITTEPSVVGYANFLTRKIETGWTTVNPDYSAELALAQSPALLVDRLNLLLSANQLAPETYNLIVDAVDSMSSSNEQALRRRVVAAVLMVMLSPDYLVFR